MADSRPPLRQPNETDESKGQLDLATAPFETLSDEVRSKHRAKALVIAEPVPAQTTKPAAPVVPVTGPPSPVNPPTVERVGRPASTTTAKPPSAVGPDVGSAPPQQTRRPVEPGSARSRPDRTPAKRKPRGSVERIQASSPSGPEPRSSTRSNVARPKRRDSADFNGDRQALVEAFNIACTDGLQAALRVQATEKGSEVVSDQFASGGNREPDVRVLSEVAGFLTEIREAVRQHTGDMAIILGRAVRLPDWAAVALGRVAVAIVPLPLDVHMQVGAAVIRVAAAFFEAEIAADEGRAESAMTRRTVLECLVDLGMIVAPYAEVRAPDVVHEAALLEPEPRSKAVTLAERLGEVEAQLIAGLVKGEVRLIGEVAELLGLAPHDEHHSPAIGVINPADLRHEVRATTQEPAVGLVRPAESKPHATGVAEAITRSIEERNRRERQEPDLENELRLRREAKLLERQTEIEQAQQLERQRAPRISIGGP